MISIPHAFLKFKSRLEITQREQDDASSRQQRIRDILRNTFDLERDFLTGSYARRTKTKPLEDVDIFCVLGEEERKYKDRDPAQLLEAFRKPLAQEYGTGSVKVQRRSVQVDFGVPVESDDAGERVMSFDVVPAFSENRHYEIPDTKLRSWIKTDPEVHMELATASNGKFSKNWVPIVKMLRTWNRTHDKPVSPTFLIEVMALGILVPPFSGGFQYELKSFFATATERIGDVWDDPARLGPPVSDQMDGSKVLHARDALRRAEEAVSRAMRHARDGRDGNALQEWRKLFGPLFPLS